MKNNPLEVVSRYRDPQLQVGVFLFILPRLTTSSGCKSLLFVCFETKHVQILNYVQILKHTFKSNLLYRRREANYQGISPAASESGDGQKFGSMPTRYNAGIYDQILFPSHHGVLTPLPRSAPFFQANDVRT